MEGSNDGEAVFFDLQVNGFAGIDFQNEAISIAELRHAVQELSRHNTQILLTLITDEVDSLAKKLDRLERFRQADSMIREAIVGYHLEGPYLHPAPGFHGPHNPSKMKAPNLTEWQRLRDAGGGAIRLMTLAPEWPGSSQFIAQLRSDDVAVGLGHTDADEKEIEDAVSAGATLCTHLGNGVPSQLDRHHNIIQRLLARDGLVACFIADGLHLPPFVLKNFVRAKPREKVIFTTDCMAAAAAPPGRYNLLDVELDVGSDRVVRQPGHKNFAGSSLTMPESLENVRRWLDWSETEVLAAHGGRVRSILGLR